MTESCSGFHADYCKQGLASGTRERLGPWHYAFEDNIASPTTKKMMMKKLATKFAALDR